MEGCYIKATCQMCGFEVEWESEKLLRKKKRVEEDPNYSGGSVEYTIRKGRLYKDSVEYDLYRNKKGYVWMRPVKDYKGWGRISLEGCKCFLKSYCEHMV